MERPRVLVVEDKPSALELLVTILERGYDVVTAPDGETALSLLGSVPVDVVVTDIRMPGANGFDVLRSVRSRGLRTNVVMLTAYANIPDAVRAIKLGAYDYLSKPLDADEASLVVARAAQHLQESAAAGGDLGSSLDDRCTCSGPDFQEAPSLGFRHAVEEARDRASRAYLMNLMQFYRGNVPQAAKRAAMTRESLYRVLRKYGVQAEDHRDDADESGDCAESPCAPSEPRN